jgi:hypothetical protein
MTKGHVRDGVAQCHWHGRRFEGGLLTPGGSPWSFLENEVMMTQTDLIVRRVHASAPNGQ